MFWDNVSDVYDVFEDIYNGDVNRSIAAKAASYIDKQDIVLELACGTGLITRCAAPACKKLVATDYSVGMLKKTQDNCFGLNNIIYRKADITDIKCKDESFDKVIAGNVIHLLDEPELAVKELCRACKPGGKVIIPTYINDDGGKLSFCAAFLEKIGLRFTRTFNEETYIEFFMNAGYENVRYHVVEGRVPCMIAVIEK